MEPKFELDSALVLNKKRLKVLQAQIKEKHLDISLLAEVALLFMQFVPKVQPPVDVVVQNLVDSKKCMGVIEKEYELFYQTLCLEVSTTLAFFTRLDAIGAGKDSMKMYEELLEGMYQTLQTGTPFSVWKQLEILSTILLDLLYSYYKMDFQSPDFFELCVQRFNQEVAESIGQVLMLSSSVGKLAKKNKKIKARFEQEAKELIHSFILTLFELKAFEQDQV